MNDLERDLATLFRDRANTIDTPAIAPDGVLRRGRRRRTGTVLGAAAGTIAAVLAIALVVQAFRAPTTEQVGGPSVTPSGTTDWTIGGRELPTQVLNGATIARFAALGDAWRLEDDNTGLTLTNASGVFERAFAFADGGGAQVDVAGGMLLLEQTIPGVQRVAVRVDGGETIDGAWMTTFRDDQGRPGRIWVVPVPGSGTGTSQVGDGLPLAISWPTNAIPTPGAILMAGADTGVSWALAWGDRDCPVVKVIEPPADPSDCLGPAQGTRAGITSVDTVAGTDRGVLAFVVPTGLQLVVTAPTGDAGCAPDSSCTPAPTNYDLTNGSWKGTSIWVMPMRLGTTYSARAYDAAGDPVGTVLKVTPGSS